MTRGTDLIAAERERQITHEGHTPEGDVGHEAQLAAAGQSYAMFATHALLMGATPEVLAAAKDIVPPFWPWNREYWKPTGDVVRDLVKGGALIAAALDAVQAPVSVRAAAVVAAGGSPEPKRYEVVTLCGSTRFKDEINSENKRLTMEGHLVISLGLFGHTDLPDYDWSTDGTDLKRTLDQIHFQKIEMADRVHVVNVGGYYGESTAREIEYARSLGKPVTFMVDVEPCS